MTAHKIHVYSLLYEFGLTNILYKLNASE